MSKTRYKIRKEQLERVVESFVMESTEGKMMVKDAAKKHKMNMGAEQHDDMGDGMKKAPVSKKHKMKQAPEVKKNIHGKVSENRMRQINKLMETYEITEDELNEAFGNSRRINKAIEDFKSTYSNEIEAIKKAYEAHTEDYINLSNNFTKKLTGDNMRFIIELAKKHGVKFDEKRPGMDSDFMTLRKSLLDMTQPMNIQTFKKQLEKGGWSMDDLGGRDQTIGK
jgi:archaellum component FlaC